LAGLETAGNGDTQPTRERHQRHTTSEMQTMVTHDQGDEGDSVSLAWAYHSPTNVHIYSLVAEHISCSVMSLLV
jgi:hypothetical protein